MTPAEAAAEVERLGSLDLQALRGVWRTHYGEAPALRAPDLLRAMLAFRLQADASGGLGPELAQALTPRRGGDAFPVGARAVREYRGVRHEVEAVSDGVLYQGRLYDSLSAVAREIAGCKWNGLRFFGLRS